MHLSEFHVVLVDDEPDVLEVSRLAMRHFKVYGLPIRLHTATSKAQAIEVLKQPDARAGRTSAWPRSR
jgi:CheY-like chemotaxis protein